MTGECPSCGSERIELIEDEAPTGVTAPDGGRERQRYRAIRCKDCGAVEEILNELLQPAALEEPAERA